MNYTDREKAQKIREQYAERPRTDFDELRELAASVKRPANIFAYSYGSAGSLVLGTGMCLAMKVIGSAVAPGVVIGAAGIAMMSSTYTLYKRMLDKRRAQHKDKIDELSSKIFGDNK